MLRGTVQCCFVAFILLGSLHAWGDTPTPRIVLLENTPNSPSAEAVGTYLQTGLGPLQISVEVVAPDVFPASQDDWERALSQHSKTQPGLLALYGWNCVSATRCNLFFIEARNQGLVVLPIRVAAPESDQDPAVSLGPSLAAAIRETLHSDLLRNVDRVATAAQGSDLAALFAAPETADEADDKSTETDTAPNDLPSGRRFALDGGYGGAFPYPDNGAVNGARMGVVWQLNPYVAPALHIGWMGMRHAASSVGKVRSSMFPTEVAMRVFVPVGAARISLAPTMRMDASLVRSKPKGSRREFSGAFELLLGGMVNWHVPMPHPRLELVLGAGCLATVVGKKKSIEQQVLLERSPFSVAWNAGITWHL
ncbi:MAG: hypothetical protein GX146_02075 [Myxococcales bacterium]|jgi:hypothetical protein|nr:hypothetical protein [Myxococcales bacterium]